jgi:beta-glucosidase
MRHLRVPVLAALLLCVWATAGAGPASADPLPYSVSASMPAPGVSPPVAADAPWTPTVRALIAQLLPSNPPTPMQLQNAAAIMHGIATVPLLSDSEPCNTIGGNLAPTGTEPVISPLCWSDALGVNIENGSQVRQTTAPPIRVAMASSWDPAMLNAWGQVEGREGRYLGVTGIYAPQSDLIRVPDWGRNLTVFSEDPFLAGTMAASEVNGIQSKGLMAQVKHFAFYNGQFMDADSQVQDQAAHELYLQPYEYGSSGSGVLPNAGQAASMMCSYARYEIDAAPGVSGSPPSDETPPSGALSCDNPVKNDVAHQLWKWQGFFASDYFFAMDSTVQSMNSGTDQEMPTNDFFGNPLVAAVESGAVSLQTFETALARILYQEQRFGLLGHADGNSNYLSPSNPSVAQSTANPVPPPGPGQTQPGLTPAIKAKDGAITERASEEGAVLLKNDAAALPLSSSDLKEGVLVVGDSAEYMPADPGPEQADGYVDRDAISPLEQLRQLAPAGSKITFIPTTPGAPPTASDGETVPQSALSTDGTTIGDGLQRTVGPGAPTIDPQIDFTSTAGHGQLRFGQTYTWSGYINVPTADDYTFRFQFSVPSYSIALPSGNAAGAVSAPSCSGAGAPTFSFASSAGTGQSMSAETLSAAPATLGTIGTSPTMSGYIERGLADCAYHAGSIAPGLHEISITWTAPGSFDSDPYRLREPGSRLPSFRFAYSRQNGDEADAIAAAKQASKVIVFADCTCVSENNGGSGTVNALDAGPTQLIADMAKANPNTIVVSNFDVATLMPWLPSVRAVLQTWYPGSEGGTATARLLLGLADPSGHLTSTWPANATDTIFGYSETKPLYAGDTTGTHPERQNGTNNSGVGPIIQWTEGIFTGYRFFDQEGITPLFPFGHGLSYTTFRYSGLTITPSGGGLDVGFDVTNTGPVAGAAVPQVYLGPAPSVPAGVQQAPRSLAGFDRVELAPGETKQLVVHIGPGSDIDGWGNRRAFQYWDTTNQTWATATGPRTVWVGSDDAPADLTLQGGT